jgi:FKBP-type peptidyl-prolyl cis-trans isomerase 2
MRIAILILILIVGGCISKGAPESPQPSAEEIAAPQVEMGDYIEVDYIGTIKDTGELFDTTYEGVAKDPNIPKIDGFTLRDKYEPLGFIVGGGEIIPAFEEALLGSKIGEERTITLSPKDAFGEVDPSLVASYPRHWEFQMVEKVPLETYIRAIREEPVVGELVNLTAYWPTEITNVTNDTVILTHQPTNGSIVNTLFGPAEVTTNETAISMWLIPEVNTTVFTRFGDMGRIIDVNESFITVDFNHPLAGKTLVFKVKVEKIIKASDIHTMFS